MHHHKLPLPCSPTCETTGRSNFVLSSLGHVASDDSIFFITCPRSALVHLCPLFPSTAYITRPDTVHKCCLVSEKTLTCLASSTVARGISPSLNLAMLICSLRYHSIRRISFRSICYHQHLQPSIKVVRLIQGMYATHTIPSSSSINHLNNLLPWHITI